MLNEDLIMNRKSIHWATVTGKNEALLYKTLGIILTL